MLIRELTLASADLRAQAAFWDGTLGLPVEQRDGAVAVRLRRSTIFFEPAAEGAAPRYHFALNVPRGSIADAAVWLAARHELLAFHGDPDGEEGATIVRIDRGGRSLYFLDAAGNVAELLDNDHLEEDYEPPFGPGSLLEIAEIGIAAADPAATVAAVRQALGAGVLWGGREGFRLTAIGDDHGVVIVAPTGRGWIPIGLAAEPQPTAIVAEGRCAGDVTLPEGPYRIRTVAR